MADDTALRPMPALVWYPPERWRTDETVLTATLPWYLPEEWAPVIGVRRGDEMLIPAVAVSGEDRRRGDRHRGWAAAVARLGMARGGARAAGGTARSAAGCRALRRERVVTGVDGPCPAESAVVGSSLPVKLRWQADGPAEGDYTVFVQLRDAQGRTVAQGDGTPTWFTPRRTDRWPAGRYTYLGRAHCDVAR